MTKFNDNERRNKSNCMCKTYLALSNAVTKARKGVVRFVFSCECVCVFFVVLYFLFIFFALGLLRYDFWSGMDSDRSVF